MLSQEVFKEYIAELEAHYGKKLTDFVKEIWFKRLSSLNNKEFVKAVSLAVCKYQFMPTPDQLIGLVREEAPHENPDAYKLVTKSLPSEQMNMSHEQRLQNIGRMKDMLGEVLGKVTIPSFTTPQKAAHEAAQRAIARKMLEAERGRGGDFEAEAPWDKIAAEMEGLG